MTNRGDVDLWGDRLRLSPEFGGQYVRVVFYVTPGEAGEGSVHWRQTRGKEFLVATFEHFMDVDRRLRTDTAIGRVKVILESPDILPKNQRLDEELYANMLSRVLKRKSWLEKQLTEEAAQQRQRGEEDGDVH